MIIEILLIVLAFLLVFAGIYSIIIPPFPGVWLVWFGVLTFAMAIDFSVVSWRAVIVFLILTIITNALDFVIPLIGAKKYKASKEGLWGSFIGSMVGLFVLGPFGAILGMFIGLAFGEVLKGKNSEEVGESIKGAFLGFIFGNLIKLSFAAAVLAYLIIALFKI